MKIAEVKNILSKYSEKQLILIIGEMYKAIPKKIKEDKDIDIIIQNLESFTKAGKCKRKVTKLPDIDELEYQVNEFVDYAYNQYYFAPNSYVHKKDRPKWRFKVKKFYKDLALAASEKDNVKIVAELLEKLYVLLCYACDYILFSGDDPFWSIGINQEDFLKSVLSFKIKNESSNDFIKNSIAITLLDSRKFKQPYIIINY